MGGAEVGALKSQSRYNKYALARNKQNQRREKKKQKDQTMGSFPKPEDPVLMGEEEALVRVAILLAR
jgi:hypothetical protein